MGHSYTSNIQQIRSCGTVVPIDLLIVEWPSIRGDLHTIPISLHSVSQREVNVWLGNSDMVAINNKIPLKAQCDKSRSPWRKNRSAEVTTYCEGHMRRKSTGDQECLS